MMTMTTNEFETHTKKMMTKKKDDDKLVKIHRKR